MCDLVLCLFILVWVQSFVLWCFLSFYIVCFTFVLGIHMERKMFFDFIHRTPTTLPAVISMLYICFWLFFLQCHCVCFCLVTAHKICIFSLLIYCFLVFGCKDNYWYTNSVLIESIVFLVILSICFLVYLMWKHSQTWVTNQYCKLIIVRLNNITILYNT